MPGIQALIGAWTDTWNAHDMHAAAALVEADVDFVTVAGRWLRGQDEFLRHHHDIHRLHMRETTWVTLGYEVRRLRDDLALAHLEWTITGERDADGSPRSPRLGIFTWLIACSRGGWLIAAAHNTNLRRDTPHRLAGRGIS
jgi:uncharacterized protein (TIGR02246 family)